MDNKVVTFDFDDTLFSLSEEKIGMLWASSTILKPIQKVHDLLFEKHKEGYIIDIVTARESWDVPEVKQYIEVYELPIRNVVYTGGKSKTRYLKEIESELHVDDLLSVVVHAEQHGIPCLLVDDGRHKNNTTADLFTRLVL
jgi:FMN phosphatase YigB (HAD superfamily)